MLKTSLYGWPFCYGLLKVVAKQVGPVRPMEGGSPADFKHRLGALLDAHEDGTPFTVQRLCEILLEPRKQYSQFEALVRHVSFVWVQLLVRPSKLSHGCHMRQGHGDSCRTRPHSLLWLMAGSILCVMHSGQRGAQHSIPCTQSRV